MAKIPQRLPLSGLVVSHVAPGLCVGLGGMHFHNMPMAVVREIIRHSIPIEVLVPPLDGSFNADQLIGAGLVREAQVAYVGFEIYGLASRFRAAVEAGTLKVRDMDEAGYLLALQAGAAGLAFAALPPGFLPETGSIPGVASANEVDYRPVLCPFTGRQEMLVRAIAPDVAIIHCQFVDADGNCGFLGAPFLDLEMARAGAKCLVQAEQQVDVLPAACRAHLPAYAVDAYCIVPGGAHPGSSHGLYQYDGEHLAAYAQASRTSAGFADYVTRIIGRDEAAYAKASAYLTGLHKQ